jgi:hypothetical protein
LIVYRKVPGLRITRSPAPQPPFWSAATVSPYSPHRGSPLSIDYLDLQATCSERMEVNVCDGVAPELAQAEQKHSWGGPVLVEATEFAEHVFRRGEAAAQSLLDRGVDVVMLVSTYGSIPQLEASDHLTLAISAWPLEFPRLEKLLGSVRDSGLQWGVLVPVVFPVTTDIAALNDLTALAAEAGAMFLTSAAIDLDPTAKQAVVRSLAVDDEDDRYAALFHTDLETINVATERHLAALAAEKMMSDVLLLPGSRRKTNWNGATLLTAAGARMVAMNREVELGWSLLRSARVVAELDKPLQRIAEAASLSIVPAIDPISAQALEQWLATGASDYCRDIDAQWRLRRDHYAE